MISAHCQTDRAGIELRLRAVTLLEVMLSVGILIFLSSMTLWFYSSSLDTSRRGIADAQKIRLMRVVLDRLSDEIRQAAFISSEEGSGILGDSEEIRLSSYRVPTRRLLPLREIRSRPPPIEFDLSILEYRILRHPDIEHEEGWDLPLGLSRREFRVPRRLPRLPDELQLGEPRLATDDAEESDTEAEGDPSVEPQVDWDRIYAPEIRYLRFCYFDGEKWWDSWQVTGESPLPQLVQVTIGFEGRAALDERAVDDELNEEFCTCQNEDPVDCQPLGRDQYSIVVRVPQADPLFRSHISREAQSIVENLGEEEETEP